MYAILCWSYFPIVYCLYPETSRRTLEDMDEMFIQNPGLVVFNKQSLTQRERPKEFIEAEAQRIAEAENTQLGKEIVKETATSHYEQV